MQHSVLVGRNRNAFCIVRPPGHHAGINGLLDGGESCGFCIFNNVAAGALYAISEDKLLCNKCAIVDIDVHHGNGTEEIVRKCHDPSKLFFFSIHLYDNDKKKRPANQAVYKFYPGTGFEDDLALNIINVPLIPLWKEPSTPLAASSLPRTHNTRQKTRTHAGSHGQSESGHNNGNNSSSHTTADVTNEDNGGGGGSGGDGSRNNINNNSGSGSGNHYGAGGKVNVNNVHGEDNRFQEGDTPKNSSRASDMSSEEGVAVSSATTSPRTNPPTAMSGRLAFRHAIQHRLLPALRAFNPDLIILSTGLDAARNDVGNARHERGGRERPGLDLDPEDYAWTTRQICQVADVCGHGRVVSVLEGGYGQTPSVPSGSDSLDRTNFSECAIRHLQALIDPYDCESRFGSDNSNV
jgi:acetoin utilization deacetylase AcuC-like enzyme